MMLLTATPEEVKKLLDTYEKDVEGIKKGCLQLAWYMRGSVTYEDVLNMSVTEREAIDKIIESNLKVTKDSGLPFF